MNTYIFLIGKYLYKYFSLIGKFFNNHLFEVLKALENLFKLEKAEGKIPIDLSGATKQLLRERER